MSLQQANLNPIYVQLDVRQFPRAAGVYMEVSQPNQPFPNPNDVVPFPGSLIGLEMRGTYGVTVLSPQNQLRGYGVYYVRVIPLDASGHQAVGRFSNPSILQLVP